MKIPTANCSMFLTVNRMPNSLPIPRVKATPDGVLFHEIDGPDGRRFIVRVLSFLPGQLLDDAKLHPDPIAAAYAGMTPRTHRRSGRKHSE